MDTLETLFSAFIVVWVAVGFVYGFVMGILIVRETLKTGKTKGKL